jgi:hypothetical protein
MRVYRHVESHPSCLSDDALDCAVAQRGAEATNPQGGGSFGRAIRRKAKRVRTINFGVALDEAGQEDGNRPVVGSSRDWTPRKATLGDAFGASSFLDFIGVGN